MLDSFGCAAYLLGSCSLLSHPRLPLRFWHKCMDNTGVDFIMSYNTYFGWCAEKQQSHATLLRPNLFTCVLTQMQTYTDCLQNSRSVRLSDHYSAIS